MSYLRDRSPTAANAATLEMVLRICSSGCACVSCHTAAKARAPRIDRVVARACSTLARSTGRSGVPICSRNAAAAARNRIARSACSGVAPRMASPSSAAAMNRRGPTAHANRSASVIAPKAAHLLLPAAVNALPAAIQGVGDVGHLPCTASIDLLRTLDWCQGLSKGKGLPRYLCERIAIHFARSRLARSEATNG
jgi:hypothetical protein